MTQLGFQLYSLHAVDEPLPAVIERVGETPFEGVEFAGLGDASVDEVTAALDASGLAPAGAHVGLEEIEADPAGVADTYRDVGCDTVTVPWLDPEVFESGESVAEAAERLTAAADALADEGLALDYHNHSQEFTDLDGGPALDRLFDLVEGVGLELDLGWVGAAGYDPLAVLDAHADRIDVVHLKDYDAAAGETAVVGEGDLDLAATVEAVRDGGFDWLVYEAEEHPDSYDTLAHAAEIASTYW